LPVRDSDKIFPIWVDYVGGSVSSSNECSRLSFRVLILASSNFRGRSR